MRKMKFYNGDVYDIGQTINGISTFIFIENRWHYYTERLMRRFEYNEDDISSTIREDKLMGFDQVTFLGNVFSHISGSN